MKTVMGLIVTLVLVMVSVSSAEVPYSTGWAKQVGTAGNEEGQAIAVDGLGNVYLCGETSGGLGGTNIGNYDVYVTKYDLSGNSLWSRQIGTTVEDWSQSMAVDSAGNLYISGYTQGSLYGTNAGGRDSFVTKFDSLGNQVWSHQFGTMGNDYIRSTSIDSSGNIYLSGETYGGLAGTYSGSGDAFVMKYDSNGNQLWAKQIGSSGLDSSWGCATDASGNVFVSGYTYGNIGGTNAGSDDAFLVKFDTSGNKLWAKQFGTSTWDVGSAVSVDASGNAYIAGRTFGSLVGANSGQDDAFLFKFDGSGNQVWGRQFGTNQSDYIRSVAVDGLGNAYIGGETYGSLGGPNAGDEDAFMTKYDTMGNLLWSKQFGTSATEYSCYITLDSSGKPYLSGYSTGNLFGTNAGGLDAFLVQVPEPMTFVLFLFGSLLLGNKRMAK